MKRMYQIVDEKGKYRSRVTIYGEDVEFTSRKSKDALIYTLDEAKALVKYYIEEKNIPVMLETTTVILKKRL